MAVAWGKCFWMALLAWVIKEVRSAKNKTLLIQLALVNISTRAIAVLVFPVPVAMTSKAFRAFFSKVSVTRFRASIW